ncbi:hypothetical protein ANCCAN_29777 [Ancylostoma caninum]|uniref:Uncharacterized protein n=1 Tax=Ancylostoma caninum TaxID=29170 RepID=A0A368F0Q7_ANCCA|nr:hypothetical protein ANCCAN_29777 [Ancylostoma caninum]
MPTFVISKPEPVLNAVTLQQDTIAIVAKMDIMAIHGLVWAFRVNRVLVLADLQVVSNMQILAICNDPTIHRMSFATAVPATLANVVQNVR